MEILSIKILYACIGLLYSGLSAINYYTVVDEVIFNADLSWTSPPY